MTLILHCAHHSKSNRLLLTYVWPPLLPPVSLLPSGNRHTVICVHDFLFVCLCSFGAFQVPLKRNTWRRLGWGCRGGCGLLLPPKAPPNSIGLEGQTQVGTQSVALKLERHYFSMVNHLIYQDQKAAFILTAWTPFFWRGQGGWQIQAHWTGHGKHNLSLSYIPPDAPGLLGRRDRLIHLSPQHLSSRVSPDRPKEALLKGRRDQRNVSEVWGVLRGGVFCGVPGHTHWLVCRSSMPSRTPFSCSFAAVYRTGFALFIPLGSPFPSTLMDRREFLAKGGHAVCHHDSNRFGCFWPRNNHALGVHHWADLPPIAPNM